MTFREFTYTEEYEKCEAVAFRGVKKRRIDPPEDDIINEIEVLNIEPKGKVVFVTLNI